MKHRIIIAAASAVAAVALTLGAVSLISSAPSGKSEVFSRAVNPSTPSHVTVCGQKVDLDRADMWERFDRELTSMVYTHRNTLHTIKRPNRYFPVMAPILKKHGVPQDMLYLACIESYLNPSARSGAGAAGIWQFMPATAKQYGLEVNDYVDERYNLEKATDEACRLLKSSLRRYGRWEDVMSAYNGGDGRITKELESQMAQSAFDLHLAEETSRYPFRVMAMKTIMEQPRAFGFTLTADQLYQPIAYKEVTVSGPVDDWQLWAKQHGTTYAQVRRDNPWIRAKSLPNKSGKTYRVKLPANASALSRSKQQQTVYNENWISR